MAFAIHLALRKAIDAAKGGQRQWYSFGNNNLIDFKVTNYLTY